VWKIRSLKEVDLRGQPKYWSEEFGWTWKDMSGSYTDAQKDVFLLPFGGVWEEQ
jgi:hypothetical protein